MGNARRWLGRPLHQRFDLNGERAGKNNPEEVTVEFFDAGHILGSVGTLIRSGGRTVFYAGDVQFDDQTISRAAQFPDFAKEPCDVMIMESTRGDRSTPPGFTRRGEEDRLAQAINDAFARGGAVMIPLFALGKTQELLAMFHSFRQKGKLRRDCPIYIGGLGAKLTEIYDRLTDRSARLQKGFDIMESVAMWATCGSSRDGFLR
jgi:Cft2 family RNA processing exonuclease